MSRGSKQGTCLPSVTRSGNSAAGLFALLRAHCTPGNLRNHEAIFDPLSQPYLSRLAGEHGGWLRPSIAVGYWRFAVRAGSHSPHVKQPWGRCDRCHRFHRPLPHSSNVLKCICVGRPCQSYYRDYHCARRRVRYRIHLARGTRRIRGQ